MHYDQSRSCLTNLIEYFEEDDLRKKMIDERMAVMLSTSTLGRHLTRPVIVV